MPRRQLEELRSQIRGLTPERTKANVEIHQLCCCSLTICDKCAAYGGKPHEFMWLFFELYGMFVAHKGEDSATGRKVKRLALRAVEVTVFSSGSDGKIGNMGLGSLRLNRFEKKVLCYFAWKKMMGAEARIAPENPPGVFAFVEARPMTSRDIPRLAALSERGRLFELDILESHSLGLALTRPAARKLAGWMYGRNSVVDSCQEGEALEVEEARGQAAELGELITPRFTMNDVALVDEAREQVEMALFAAELPDKVRMFKKGTGTVLLFCGPSGTGKSVTAEAIAHRLKKNLLVVDFSKIFSRWLGDTDKQLARVFALASERDLVVCIDEADSVLYDRRFADKDHDIRFVNDMLKYLEEFKGVVVLTTNRHEFLDDALERRVSSKIFFGEPDVVLRRDIWKKSLSRIPHLCNIDVEMLAHEFEFSGGLIQNAVFNAWLRMKKDRRRKVTMNDVLFAARCIATQRDMKSSGAVIGF